MDEPRRDEILGADANLGLPVNLHLDEDRWMFEPRDQHNDGLMNACKWRIVASPDLSGHNEVIVTLEKMHRENARQIFTEARERTR